MFDQLVSIPVPFMHDLPHLVSICPHTVSLPVEKLALINLSIGVVEGPKRYLSVPELPLEYFPALEDILSHHLLIIFPLPSKLISISIQVGPLSIPFSMFHFPLVDFPCSKFYDCKSL